MKTQLMKLTAGLLLVMMATSMKYPDTFTPTGLSKTDEWGEWKNISCYKGIDFRTKRGDYNSYAQKWYWYVQFRNRYYEGINFNYILTEPGLNAEPDHRTYVIGSNESDTKVFLLGSSSGCHVLVDKVRFGYNDTGNFYSCDQ